MPRFALPGLVGLALILSACPAATDQRTNAPERTSGTATDEPTQTASDEPTEEPVTGEGCPADVIESDPPSGSEHVPDGETVEYDTNPPVAGPHAASTADVGAIYGGEDVPPVEQLVHNMEHGAVIFWTNNLSPEERTLAEETVNEIYASGYTSLIMVEYNEMEVPFAMTAWGVLQECLAMDETTAQLMQLFTDSFYGSGVEGSIACAGEAVELPACKE